MERHWNEVKCDYNNGEGFWLVDAWVTDDDNEDGKVIAVIEETSKHVYYIDLLARRDEYVQEVIKAKLAEI